MYVQKMGIVEAGVHGPCCSPCLLVLFSAARAYSFSYLVSLYFSNMC